MDYTVHGILQAGILEWVTFPFSRGSSQPRDQTQVSRIADGFFTHWATREAPGILVWVAFPFSRGSSQPRNWTRVSCMAGGFFINWDIREAPLVTTTLFSVFTYLFFVSFDSLFGVLLFLAFFTCGESYSVCLSPSDLHHVAWYAQCPPLLSQMQASIFLWISSIPHVCACMHTHTCRIFFTHSATDGYLTLFVYLGYLNSFLMGGGYTRKFQKITVLKIGYITRVSFWRSNWKMTSLLDRWESVRECMELVKYLKKIIKSWHACILSSRSQTVNLMTFPLKNLIIR